jgi:hypothetical protein
VGIDRGRVEAVPSAGIATAAALASVTVLGTTTVVVDRRAADQAAEGEGESGTRIAATAATARRRGAH